MFLRRKQAFQSGDMTAKSTVAGYLDRTPEADYIHLQGSEQGKAWIGEHRNHGSRELAVVEPLTNVDFMDFRCLARIAHPNIARLIALYHKDESVHVVYEYAELDLLDICPLSEAEIAEVLSQVLFGVRKLLELSIGFCIHSVRVTSYGAVKIVLDWSNESVLHLRIQEALRSYIAVYLHDTMQRLGCSRKNWTAPALAFLELLNAGYLPMATDPFLADLTPLRGAAQFTIRRRLATL